MFFFTIKSNSKENYTGTSVRLTVQALAIEVIPNLLTSEFCCIRGIPGNPFSASTIFGIIWHDLHQTLSDVSGILPVFVTKRTSRKQGKFESFCEELFLCLYSSDPNRQATIQPQLHLLDNPILYTALAWRGEMAKSMTDYDHSPTNNDNLFYRAEGLMFAGTTQSIEEFWDIIKDYISPTTPISYAVCLQGHMDSPWVQNPDNILVFISQYVGVVPEFNTDQWVMDGICPITPTRALLPGLAALLNVYVINPPLRPRLPRTTRPPPLGPSTYSGGSRLVDDHIERQVLLKEAQLKGKKNAQQQLASSTTIKGQNQPPRTYSNMAAKPARRGLASANRTTLPPHPTSQGSSLPMPPSSSQVSNARSASDDLTLAMVQSVKALIQSNNQELMNMINLSITNTISNSMSSLLDQRETRKGRLIEGPAAGEHYHPYYLPQYPRHEPPWVSNTMRAPQIAGPIDYYQQSPYITTPATSQPNLLNPPPAHIQADERTPKLPRHELPNP